MGGACLFCANSSTSESKLARYINSRHWAGLAEALYQSTNSPFDHLVRLRLESSLISGRQIPGVDLITFRDMNAIPNLLQSHPGDHPIPTTVSHEKTGGPHVATAEQVTATDGIDGTGDQHEEVAAEYSVEDAIDIIGDEGPDRSNEALIIQRAARRYLLNRVEGSSGRDRLFKACKAVANAVHARYRKIYLGPVPHLLLCVEWIISSAQESKGTIKARRGRPQATLLELSDLTFQQTQVKYDFINTLFSMRLKQHRSGILKDARELQRRLEPGSSLHPQADIPDGWYPARDLGPLRSAVTKVRDLFKRLSDPKFPTVEFLTVELKREFERKFEREFKCAWNGIMPSSYANEVIPNVQWQIR
jgi:hypothetical protein